MVAGDPATDGMLIFARVGAYEFPRVLVKGGKYGFGGEPLAVGPQDRALAGRTITFHAIFGFVDVPSVTTDVFTGAIAVKTLDLEFLLAPPGTAPTPTSTATPVPTPTPTPQPPATGDRQAGNMPAFALGLRGVMPALGLGTLMIRRRLDAS